MTLTTAFLIFAVSTVAIGWVGIKLTRLADRLADRTGLGEAFVGAVFLGAVTSLPGITASVIAAWDGRPSMALSNAIGGIAAQTAFLGIADLSYRKANLEHAAASLPNMLQATILIVILSFLMIAMSSPEWTLFAVHPVSILMFVVYFAGLRMVRHVREDPMWSPQQTEATFADTPEEPRTDLKSDFSLWAKFFGAAVVVVIAGYWITKAVSFLADEFDWLNDSIAGAAMIAIATSLPELVTSISAVRQGALTLAVGGIIGGNCFDTLFAAVADIAYRDGSLYHAIPFSSAGPPREFLIIASSMLMTAMLLWGLLRRQKAGPGGIGFESVTVLLSYIGMMVLLAIS